MKYTAPLFLRDVYYMFHSCLIFSEHPRTRTNGVLAHITVLVLINIRCQFCVIDVSVSTIYIQ